MNTHKPASELFVTQPYMPPLSEFMFYLEEIWEKKWLTNNGAFHQQLESELCKYLGVKYISLFANGTLALQTALQAMRITGEVITTPYSFVATTHSLHWNGIKPVFVDIDPISYNVDPRKIEAAITPQTTAILPVHVYGNPCDVEAIQRIGDTYGLKVIYDAAHAFGVKIDGKSVLNFGDLSVLSFHATKVFNTFEGGAIVCKDECTKRRIDYLKNFGFLDEVTVIGAGINAKMDEIRAAFGLLQLKHMDSILRERKRVDTTYRTALNKLPGITAAQVRHNVEHNYSYFPVLVDSRFGRSRDELYEHLKANGVFSRRYFYPLISDFQQYRGLPSSAKSNLPVANRTAEQILCLPIYPDLQDNDVMRVIQLIQEASSDGNRKIGSSQSRTADSAVNV